MKKSAVIAGVAVFVLILVVGGFFFLNKNNQSKSGDQSLALDAQGDYVGEQTTIIHKDFTTVIKSDWQKFESSPSLYVYLPPDTAQDDVNAEVISIAVSFLGENNEVTLDELLEQGVENSKKIMPDFELTENIDSGKLNMPGKQIKFMGTQDGVKRENIQVFGIKYDILYSVTYSCPVGGCNYHAVYNGLVESFEPVKAEI
jgi:hypothetical protein